MCPFESQRREESLQGKIPSLTPAEVLLDCPGWRTDAIAEPVTGGDLSVSLLTKRLGIHRVCQIWSAQSRQLWSLFSQISWCLTLSFLAPAGGSWQAVHMVCAVAFQKPCPLSEASCSELIAPETAEFTECLLLFRSHSLEMKVHLLAISRALICCRTHSRMIFLSICLSHHLLGTRGFTARHWLVPFVLGHFELVVPWCWALFSDAWCPLLVLRSCMNH